MDSNDGIERPMVATTARRVRWLVRSAAALLIVVALAACADGTGTTPPTPPPDGDTSIALEPVSGGTFERPLGAVTDGASSRSYVLEQGGTVEVIEEDGTLREEPFLELMGYEDFVFTEQGFEQYDERGLLGMAFHPDDAGTVYVHYNDAAGDTVVSAMEVTGLPDAPVADLGSEQRLVEVPQDPGTSRHRGGQLAFGPDGMLYVALGDGGNGDNARNPGDPRGSILRLDVDRPADGYVPADGNAPAADDVPGRDPLVLHYGLRNPWRFSFDGDDLWIADVGEDLVEEVNLVDASDAGHDFGWDLMEGDRCIVGAAECEGQDSTQPVLTYEHEPDDEGGRRSVTGGYVYRGDDLPALEGAYVYGDYLTGTIWAVEPTGDGVSSPEMLLDTDLRISSFGVDADGELLVVHYDEEEGSVHRIVAD